MDTARPHPARVYDYLLGGKDNFAADRDAGDAMIARLPGLPAMTRANRDFLGRAVRHLVRTHGVRHFLDIGSGIPTSRNVHEIAQAADPGARVVYVDDDPVVAAHSRALLTGAEAGRTAFVHADATDPAAVLAAPAVAELLDRAEPVALMVVSVLMYFPDDTAHRIVDTLLAALPPGSFLTVSHPTADFDPAVVAQAVAAARRSGLTYITRTRAEVEAFFAGTDPVEPGVVPLLAWRPDGGTAPPDPHGVYYWAGMARRR
ncbi:SAM-dependent methyltransferase [Pseudonocardia humida]|uniref:SAM-dependent methyltransferase n=1 Tax=Pseudonocardia humida TaxID=2800819 RepID=A0ABT1A7H6_9PSEU|nr:SAM-dependent methyltransferase [Pseudonocardia humida]MCO1658978.1 SAM-dependent methyltransferase [Pseudonocardia humida]